MYIARRTVRKTLMNEFVRDIRGLVASELEQFQLHLARGVDREYPRARDVDTTVGQGIRYPVAKAGVEWLSPLAEQALNVAQTGHLENLRFAHDDFSEKDGSVQRRFITNGAVLTYAKMPASGRGS